MSGGRATDFTLHLAELRDLFVAPEPAPFSAHPNYESGIDQIFNSLRRRKPRQRLTATVQVAAEVDESTIAATPAALRAYCDSRIEAERVIISCHRREGAAKLGLGIVFLAATLGVKAVLDQFTLEPDFLNQFLSEGLTVLGWVMLWAPLALLLLDWWPARRNIDGYLAIRDMQLEILSGAKAAADA